MKCVHYVITNSTGLVQVDMVTETAKNAFKFGKDSSVTIMPCNDKNIRSMYL